LIIVCSYSLEKTIAIFNYDKVTWTDDTKNILIGFTDAKNKYHYTNQFSKINHLTKHDPSLISTSKGNTGIIGTFVYDISTNFDIRDERYKMKRFLNSNQCDKWFTQKLTSNNSDDHKKETVPCPSHLKNAWRHPFYIENKYKTWHDEITIKCFHLKTNIFKQNYNQQFCCYNKLNGALISLSGSKNGFIYGNDKLFDVIQNGFALTFLFFHFLNLGYPK
jgi:hypothetical protein